MNQIQNAKIKGNIIVKKNSMIVMSDIQDMLCLLSDHISLLSWKPAMWAISEMNGCDDKTIPNSHSN